MPGLVEGDNEDVEPNEEPSRQPRQAPRKQTSKTPRKATGTKPRPEPNGVPSFVTSLKRETKRSL